MNKIMLDLETMGTSSNAAIIAIGAVRFDDEQVTSEFYSVVDLQSSVNYGMVIEPDTVLWWMRQSEDARSQFNKSGGNLARALQKFTGWIGEDAEVWGNGAAFDNVILSNAYRLVELVPPWEFYNDRCYLTVKNSHLDVSIVRVGTLHNAIDDATSQAQHLIRILDKYPQTS